MPLIRLVYVKIPFYQKEVLKAIFRHIFNQKKKKIKKKTNAIFVRNEEMANQKSSKL